MDGLEFVDQALRKRPDIRYLFISGNPRQAVAGRDGRVDISRILNKPFRKRELSERVRATLDTAAD
jgi:CheY-like chemotaxis protein